MSFQDEKLVIIDQARFKYQVLDALIKKYGPLVRLPATLQEEFMAYGKSVGWFAAESFEKILQREYSQIRAPEELKGDIFCIVNYNFYRAEEKWIEFKRLREKTTLEMPPRLEDAVRACEERGVGVDQNLYGFENALGAYWSQVKIDDAFRDELRLVASWRSR